jgi:hypothetical protein
MRLIAVEEPQFRDRWRIGISGANGGNGRVPGWENARFYSYSACATAIDWIEKFGGSYAAYLSWKKQHRGKGE